MTRDRSLPTRPDLRHETTAVAAPPSQGVEARPPNFVIVYADDLGYSDVNCFSPPLFRAPFRTPRLDRMAAEGMKFTEFYSASPICTPARAALLTGCYAQRVSMAAIPQEDDPTACTRPCTFPNSRYGLHPDEVTLAEILKARDYATACIGKWHLGDAPEFLPTRQGFDRYLGIPYSNDMQPCVLIEGETVVENPVDQDSLTERYTQEAVKFIEHNRDRPFFLYLAHTMPHRPLHVSDRFRGRSRGGLYGDVIECLDWSTGEVLDALDRAGLDDNTLVVFTSDNGPWYVMGEQGGYAAPLRGQKGTTYEGGLRVPCIMRWPGRIPAGAVCRELATQMDLLPTFAKLAGGSVPTDRVIDGKDISPLLTGQPDAHTPYEVFYYYLLNELHAVRSGPWKLRLQNTLRYEDLDRAWPDPDAVVPEALYDLRTDPGEQKNLARFYPDVVKHLQELAEAARRDLGDSRQGVKGSGVRPIGMLPPRA